MTNEPAIADVFFKREMVIVQHGVAQLCATYNAGFRVRAGCIQSLYKVLLADACIFNTAYDS